MKYSRLISDGLGFLLGCAGGVGVTFAIYGPNAPIGWLQRLACGLFEGVIGCGLGAAFRIRL